MKKTVAFILLLITVIPQISFAAFGTQVADLEDSSSQYFSRADTASLSITGSIAVECWVKLESVPTGTQDAIMAKLDTGASRSWLFNMEDVGAGVINVQFRVDQNGDNSIIAYKYGTTDMATKVGTWTHVAASWTAGSGNAPTVFVDGVDDGTFASGTGAGSIFDGGVETDIGAIKIAGAATRFLDGEVANCRVWSTTRTASDFSGNWCTQLGSTSNYAAEWTLDNTVNDNSGNANTLTNNNSTQFVSDVPTLCVPLPNSTTRINNGTIRVVGEGKVRIN